MLNRHYSCGQCAKNIGIRDVHMLSGQVLCAKCHAERCREYEKTSPQQAYTGTPPAMYMIRELMSNYPVPGEQDPVQIYYLIEFVPTQMPLCYVDTLCMFTKREIAHQRMTECITDEALWQDLSVRKVNAKQLPAFLGEMLSCGYENAVVDGHQQTIRQLLRLPEAWQPDRENAELSNTLIFYQQTMRIYGYTNTRKPDPLHQVEKSMIELLQRSSLYLPPEREQTKPAMVTVKDETWIAVFTDSFAVVNYYSQPSQMRVTLDQLRQQLQQNPMCRGIVINPGRQRLQIETQWLETMLST